MARQGYQVTTDAPPWMAISDPAKRLPKDSVHPNAGPSTAWQGYQVTTDTPPRTAFSDLANKPAVDPARFHRARGFTLIELLVVLVIIGVLATMVSLSVTGRAVDDRMQAEARRIESLLRLASDEAQAKGFELGLRNTDTGFEFLTLDNSGTWTPVDEGPFRAREVPEPFFIELRVEGRLIKPAPPAVPKPDSDKPKFFDNEAGKKAKDRVEPAVLILSTGEMTAFTLDLRLKNVGRYYRVEGDALGQLSSQSGQDRT